MLPHQERVIAECRELEEKRKKLLEFIASEKFMTIPHGEALRLDRQSKIMGLYCDVLEERIVAFQFGKPEPIPVKTLPPKPEGC